MSTNFPGALDSLTNPLGSDSTAVVSHAAQHTNANDAIEALQVRVGTDSAPGLARLDGVVGGQTLIGGTAATDALTLQGTSGDGTATATAVRVAVGNNGSTDAVTVRNDGNVGIGNTNPSTDLSVGADVLRVDGSLLAIGATSALGLTTVVSSGSQVNGKTNARNVLADPAVRSAGRIFQTDITLTGNTALTQWGNLVETSIPVTNTYNITATNLFGVSNIVDIKGSGSTKQVIANNASCQFDSSSTATFLCGTQSQAYHLGAGVVTAANALVGWMHNSDVGTITTAWGTEGLVYNEVSSGLISTAIGVGARISNVAGATITNAYGVNIGGPSDLWSNAGTLTNCYALYIGSSTNVGTNKWSIYNESPAVSYLAGSLALGVTAASAKVHAISTTEQLRRGYDASNYLSSTTDSTGKTTFTAVGTAPNLKWLMSDATTNAIYDLVTFSKNSSSAGAAGLGVRVNLAAKSSTTADTLVGAIDASWVDATHASRKGRVKINAYDTAIRECIRAEASGTAAMLGFFGVTAVVRPTALTTQLTTLTYTAPSVADYAIQNLTSTGGFGFVTADEGNSVLAVIKNLQDRVAQLETKLQSLGLLT